MVVPRELTEAALKRLRSVLQRRCMINVHMGADVVLGVSDNPVYLEGYGWTAAPVGRRVLSQNAEMRRIIDDPVTGQALNISAMTYTPSAEMAAAARMRDQLCTFPTCERRSADCQLDHTVPHPKGRAGSSRPGDRHQTSADGLGSLCDAEHRLKTLGGWQVARLDGQWEWRSPAGKVYLTTTTTYSPQTLDELVIAENTRIEFADLVAGELDEEALTRAVRRDAVNAVLWANDPAPF